MVKSSSVNICRIEFAGTVVKRKKGAILADLAHPGDEVIVARGGQGGVSC